MMNINIYKDEKKHIFIVLKQINWFMFSILFILFVLGCMVLYSASGGDYSPLVKNHIIKFLFSLVVFFIICFINYKLIKDFSFYFYLLSIFLLVYLIFFGVESAGSKRWIELGLLSLQPSEFSKIFLILALSKYYEDLQHLSNRSILKIIFPILLILIPFTLIANQPDLGTSVLLLANGLCLIVLSGISIWLILIGLIMFMLAIPVAWQFLFDYQKNRILTFLNPDVDPLGSGYHISQSKIAIGSGGFTGKGYMQGSQSQLEFIPEIHTDFVFSVFAEEFGLVGAVILIILYSYLFIYGLISCYRAREIYEKLVIFGLTMNIFLYFLINIAMVIGLVPVVGVPLPIVSYGGSSMLAVIISLGIIEKININGK